MEQWYCFKDKVAMVEGKAILEYLDVTNSVDGGIKCPKCGTIYVLEKTVLEKVNKAEEMLESK